jgi:hypothetical protein
MKTCFVIMPFTSASFMGRDLNKEDLDHIFNEFIKKATEEYLVNDQRYFDDVRRFDNQVGSIIKGIVKDLLAADLVIADLTGMNPNVLYELGIRHSIKSGTIMLTQSFEEFPTDLRDYLTVEYRFSNTTTEDKLNYEKFKISIHQAIRQALETETLDSPVTEYIQGKVNFIKEDEIIQIKEQTIILKSLYADMIDLNDILYQYNLNSAQNKPDKAFIEIITLFVNSLHSKLGLLNFKVNEKFLFVDIEMTKNFLIEILKVLQIDDYLQVTLNLPSEENVVESKTVKNILETEFIDPIHIRKKRDVKRVKLVDAFNYNEFFFKDVFQEAVENIGDRAEKLGIKKDIESLIKIIDERK